MCFWLIIWIIILIIIFLVMNNINEKDKREQKRVESNKNCYPDDWYRDVIFEIEYDEPQIVTGDYCNKISVGTYTYKHSGYESYLRCRYAGTANCVNCARRSIHVFEKKYKYGSSNQCKEEVYIDSYND